MQRKLKIYLSREKLQFKLHVVQIEAKDVNELNNNAGYIDPMLMFFLRPQDIFNLFYIYLASFNNLKMGNFEQRQLYNQYLCSENVDEQIVIDICDRNAAYGYNMRSYLLPVNATDLLKFLGVIDSAIQMMLHQSQSRDEVMGIEYCDQLPDFNQKADICHRTLERYNKVPLLPKNHLSRHIAEWMVGELSRDVETSSTCTPLIERLTEMLKKEAGSLTPAIRQYLYPDPPVADVLKEYCQDADELTIQLLNPVLSLTERANSLLKFIKAELKKKPLIKTEDPLDTQNEKVAKQNQIPDIHAKIAEWFNTYDQFRKIVWSKQVENLYGKLADDGGYYNKNYTELRLLRDAKLIHKTNGLMQLEFLDTASYKRNYAPGLSLHHKLETELRAACGDLDLHFLPDQDFHQQVVFDEASSERLIERGYHFSAQFCKDQLRSEINKRQFMFSANKGCTNPFTRLGKDVHGLLLLWINRAYRDQPSEENEVKEQAGAVRLLGRFG